VATPMLLYLSERHLRDRLWNRSAVADKSADLGDVVNLRLGGFAVNTVKIQRNPEQITRLVRATLKGVRFMKSDKAETLAIMRDYLKISGTT
jgi:ABC-type nitrate/sulfonate/bicarbonate transport system substrate-binding protein